MKIKKPGVKKFSIKGTGKKFGGTAKGAMARASKNTPSGGKALHTQKPSISDVINKIANEKKKKA